MDIVLPFETDWNACGRFQWNRNRPKCLLGCLGCFDWSFSHGSDFYHEFSLRVGASAVLNSFVVDLKAGIQFRMANLLRNRWFHRIRKIHANWKDIYERPVTSPDTIQQLMNLWKSRFWLISIHLEKCRGHKQSFVGKFDVSRTVDLTEENKMMQRMRRIVPKVNFNHWLDRSIEHTNNVSISRCLQFNNDPSPTVCDAVCDWNS